MAKVDIGDKKFTKLLLSLPYKPNKNLIKRLDSKMFSLDMNLIFNYKPELLAYQEYKRCLELFQIRNPGLSPEGAVSRIAGVQKLIVQAEAPIKKELEALAIQTIKNIYQVPDYIDLRGMIWPRLSFDTEQDHTAKPFLGLTLEQKNKMRDEIQKRIILNGLVHGSAMHVWKGVYHLVTEELDKIDSSLKELYDSYTSNIGLAIWLLDPDDFAEYIQDGTQITQGFNKLKFNRAKGYGGQIEAKGINFPVLLHELNKGVIDWLISSGIPKDYTEEELTYYYSKADDYTIEIYHYLLSPSLWAGLLDVLQVDNQRLPKIISQVSKLSYAELSDLFRSIIDGKELGTLKAKKYNLI